MGPTGSATTPRTLQVRRPSVTPTGAEYWSDVAQRYHAAAGLLTDPALRATAEERAKASEALAHAVAEMAPAAKPSAKK